MEYVRLGNSGLKVSRLCLGCMTYGTPGEGPQPWSLSAEEGMAFIFQALENGINFFDTANMYSLGESERILGRALREYTIRDDVVIATKVSFPLRSGPNAAGLSRKAIMREIDESLRRLGTDYVDLYQIHRWDPTTPIEETMEALHDVVRAGKARYIGASSMYAWQFAKALHMARLNGWTRFISMQNHLNLLYREEEREMMPLCRDEGIGVMPWSPLARGRLTRPFSETPVTARGEQDKSANNLYARTQHEDRAIVDAVAAIAMERGCGMAQVALAWVMTKSPVASPIVGATKPQHLDDALASLSVKLSDEEIARLEAPYRAHDVVGLN